MAKKTRYIDAEPIKKFIVDGLNNPNIDEAFGHDAIEILAEIEYAPRLDVEKVVRCEKCVLHGNCSTEDAFLFARIANPYCCAGKEK